MKKCTFIGNYKPVTTDFDWSSLSDSVIWTLGSWYRPYKDIEELKEVDAIFQIHANFDGTSHPDRYSNWEEEYNKAKGLVYTVSDYDNLDNYEKLDMQMYIDRFGMDFFSCTVNFMFAKVIMDKIYDHVQMVGFYMIMNDNEISTEYAEQVPGVLRAIKLARENGITVDCPMEKTWLNLAEKNGIVWDAPKVDWVNMKNGLVPYWMQGQFAGNERMQSVKDIIKEFNNIIGK